MQAKSDIFYCQILDELDDSNEFCEKTDPNHIK